MWTACSRLFAIFDLSLCSLQTIISQSHARACKGEKAVAPPL